MQAIAEHTGETLPSLPRQKPYLGYVSKIPKTVAGISKLPVTTLRQILHYHDLPILGCKEQLTLRVFLLQQGETSAILAREEEKIADLIRIYKQLAVAQRRSNLRTHMYKKRTYTASKQIHNFVPVPTNISISNLHKLFDPVLEYIQTQRQARKDKDKHTSLHRVQQQAATNSLSPTLKEKIKQIGAKIKIMWEAEEISDSGWRPGWYTAYVQAYDEEDDILTVHYPSEPTCTYTIELTSMMNSKKIKLGHEFV